MSDPLEIQVRYLLKELSIPPGYKGYRYAVMGVTEIYYGATAGEELCRRIAARFGERLDNVERCLRYMAYTAERESPEFCKRLLAYQSSEKYFSEKVLLNAGAEWLRLHKASPAPDAHCLLPPIRWQLKGGLTGCGLPRVKPR